MEALLPWADEESGMEEELSTEEAPPRLEEGSAEDAGELEEDPGGPDEGGPEDGGPEDGPDELDAPADEEGDAELARDEDEVRLLAREVEEELRRDVDEDTREVLDRLEVPELPTEDEEERSEDAMLPLELELGSPEEEAGSSEEASLVPAVNEEETGRREELVVPPDEEPSESLMQTSASQCSPTRQSRLEEHGAAGSPHATPHATVVTATHPRITTSQGAI